MDTILPNVSDDLAQGGHATNQGTYTHLTAS